MATEITEKFITDSDLVLSNTMRATLSYYDKANDIIKRTHVAMGKTIKTPTTTIASTINGTITTSNRIKTH